MGHPNAVRRLQLVLRGSAPPTDFGSGPVRIGRSSEADFVIPDEEISPRHVELDIREGSLWARDLGSETGTFVDGHRLSPNEPVRCRDIQVIRLGSLALCVRLLASEAPAEDGAEGVVHEAAPEESSHSMEIDSPSDVEKVWAEIFPETLGGPDSLAEILPPAPDVSPSIAEPLTEREKELRDSIASLAKQAAERSDYNKVIEGEITRSAAELLTAEKQREALQARIETLRDRLGADERRYGLWKQEKTIEIKRTELAISQRRQAMQNELASLQLSLTSLASQKASAEREMKGLDLILHQKQVELEHLRKRAEKLSDQNERAEEKQALLRKEYQEVYDSFLKSTERYKEAAGMVASLEKQLEALTQGRDEAKRGFEELRTAAEREAEAIRASAREEGKSLVASLRAQAAQELADEKTKLRDELAARSKTEADALEKELKGKRQAVERELGRQLALADTEARLKIEAQEEKWKRLQDVRIRDIADYMEQAIRKRLAPFSGSADQNDELTRLMDSVRTIVERAFFSADERVEEGGLAVTAADRERGMKTKRFWRNFGLGTTGAVVAFSLLVALWLPMKRFARSLLPQKAADDQYVQKATRELAARSQFNPPMDTGFRPTYTDNVLYTTQYLIIKLDEKIHKAWVLELNKFLMNDLHLDERAIVKYASTETVLINRLAELRNLITAPYANEGIARMREAEMAAVPELVGIVSGVANLSKVRDFEGAFYRRRLGETSHH